MAEDVTETKNMAERHPDMVKRLTRLHEERVKDVGQR
jgi:hypothetical protein